ncbi:hypothetical protein [Pseudomonas sp. TNT2022 ID642]|uniref:hypothetical protein n=1 Tax=Pseudomonas sp. TNT2022 ID642 TaxID=2942632 RepID=UPI00235FB6A8|nr:hypothetical protein [Pseudomonas sp. TNT2022 ID642]MDD1002179.1 hypothetical protein [Pseudomonas sp. TNT2022 ID642]
MNGTLSYFGPTHYRISEQCGEQSHVRARLSTALLCDSARVDTQEIKSLCCAAAGISAFPQAATEALPPQEKLRRAATPNATLTAQQRSSAQLAEGYKPVDDDADLSLPTYHLDKIPEDKMAELVGTTRRALQGKRARGVIPKGVWNTIDNRIYYSIRRYEAWLESQWDCPPELNLLDSPSAFASLGTGNAVAKPSPIPKRRRGLRLPPTYALT